MKKLLPALAILLTVACNFTSNYAKHAKSYGKNIDTINALTLSDAYAQKGIGKTCIVKGKIDEVCQAEGCWLNAESGNGEKVMLWFKNDFTVPKDISGKTVVAQGTFYYDTTTVAELKDYAKDDNQPQSAIDTITKPKIEVKFHPIGVVVY